MKHRSMKTKWQANFSLFLTLLTAYALLLWIHPAAEAAKMYYTHARGIDRAEVKGGSQETLLSVTLSSPQFIAVDPVGGKIYWMDTYTDKIQRANLDGTNVQDLVTTGLSNPAGIAVDASGGKMYWTDINTQKIQRANLDGTNVQGLVTTGAVFLGGIAVDAGGGKMYWTDVGTGKIQQANLDGTNVQDLATSGFPIGIAVDGGGGKLYWTDSAAGTIQRANLDGTHVQGIVTGLVSPQYIALDFATTAGTVTLVNQNPLLTWNYQLTHNSGAIEKWTYTGALIAGASVDGAAAAAGWSVGSQTDTQVVFVTTTPLTSGSLTGFHIIGTAGGTGTWTAGGNSGSVEGSLPVELSAFTAEPTPDGVRLKWRTESESNNLGFYLYRSTAKDGDYVRVTPTLIKGHGTDATPHEYSFMDETAKDDQSYWYLIEDVDLAGTTERSDPILVIFHRPVGPRHTVPLRFALHQNYPNPFNPETWMPYDLAADADVVITIYNARGQRIRTLALGTQTAGTYRSKESAAYWDGRSEIGEWVSSGLYFYHLRGGDFTAAKRMVILK
ncbi:T9SS type A sorting domain-containing protein [Candidatus Poribacteria bacterium]|nr:T9SS type A sorting domain-containing protein [Candidatus Poribacteria bacterium]